MGRNLLVLLARVRRTALAATIALALVGCGSGGESRAQPTLRVMTQNLYYGAAFDPVVGAIAAGDPDAIVGAATQVWAEVRMNDFATRAEAVADQILASRPHFVGLQEAAVFRTQFPSDAFTAAPSPALFVELDYTQILLAALAARGLHYEVVASIETLDAEVPALTDDLLGLQDLRITDHDVLLARTDLEQDGILLFNPRAELYQTVVPLPGGLDLPNGWVSVDIVIGGRIVRVVSTHLASDVEAVQRAQAAEAIGVAFDGVENFLFMGDFNSDALPGVGPDDTATRDDVLAAGFVDAWDIAHPALAGATWGRPDDIGDPVVDPVLTERIDYVFFSGRDLALEDVDVVGEDVADRRNGLWCSDHAGVTARFRIR